MPALKAWFRLFGIPIIALCASGCGVRVPDIPEFPGKPGDTALLVDAIARSIHCGIKDAVKYVIAKDIESSRWNGVRTVPWFDNWGVAGILTLSVAERTEVNPTSFWSPNAIFSLGANLDGSARAIRVDTLNFYYNVKDLNKEEYCTTASDPHPVGSLLIDNDLKIRQWLVSQLLPIGTGEIAAITKSGITHDIRFDVSTTGSINPAWKLSRVIDINSNGTLFSANRDRTHELSITFGPADPDQKILVGAAGAQFNAALFGTAFRNALGP